MIVYINCYGILLAQTFNGMLASDLPWTLTLFVLVGHIYAYSSSEN